MNLIPLNDPRLGRPKSLTGLSQNGSPVFPSPQRILWGWFNMVRFAYQMRLLTFCEVGDLYLDHNTNGFET